MNDKYVSIPFQIDREFPFYNASIPVQNLIRTTRALKIRNVNGQTQQTRRKSTFYNSGLRG